MKTLIQIEKLILIKFSSLSFSKNPSYIDMPVWYTHNIHNIGNEPLITLFWINEFMMKMIQILSMKKCD